MSSVQIPIDRNRLLREKFERHVAAGERELARETLDRLIDNSEGDERQAWVARRERGAESPTPPPQPARKPTPPKPTGDDDDLRWHRLVAAGQTDFAYCVSEVMVALGKANDVQRQFREAHRPTAWVAPTGKLTYDDWVHLRHPDEDQHLSAVLGLLATGLHRLLTQKLDTWGLHPRRDMLPPTSDLMPVRVLKAAAGAVGHDNLPHLYLSQHDVGLRNANVEPAAIVVGSDIVGCHDEREVAHYGAHLLCRMRPEYAFASLGFPIELVELVVAVAQQVALGKVAEVTELLGEHAVHVAKELQRLPAPIADALFRRLEDLDDDVDIERWFRVVDHTASRVGLLVCGDLPTAVEALRTDRPDHADQPDARMRELLRFAVSPRYPELRSKLGVAVATR